MEIPNATVIDIMESDDGTATYLHLLNNEGESYIVYYLGVFRRCFWWYGLPISNITFENVGATYTEAIVMAGVNVELID